MEEENLFEIFNQMVRKMIDCFEALKMPHKYFIESITQ